jgi:prepilin-type N-terminal cleavage/methylation domain-containing protein
MKIVPDFRRSCGAFTLIEIMVVVALLAVIMAMGIPSIVGALKAEGLRKATNDLTDACNKARAHAIMSGTVMQLNFHPLEKTFDVGAAGAAASDANSPDAGATPNPNPAPAGVSGQLPDNVTMPLLYVNMVDKTQADSASVRFFPNGTCDEMSLILQGDKNEMRMISLEITTGLASVENNPQKFR